MNVLAFASRKGGAGKSTLAAHLAAYVHGPTRRCLLIDDDPQGSLTLWNEPARRLCFAPKDRETWHCRYCHKSEAKGRRVGLY
jgi:MinD superfamily P-loop ATPase